MPGLSKTLTALRIGETKAAPLCAKQRQAGCPWRSCPDRIMPGTDVGTAPQESRHNATLIPACESPLLLARRLQESIAAKDLQCYQAMAARGETLQDWPHIGCFVNQHSFKNEAALAAEGRTSAKNLLEWGLHKRHADTGGNVWMLIPSSKLEVDWAACSPPEMPKKKTYKPRALWALPEDACKHYAALMTASSEREVEVALSALKLYDVRQQSFRSWRDAAKAFDDWRCVLLWQLHQTALPEESSASPHTACLLSLLGTMRAHVCMLGA